MSAKYLVAAVLALFPCIPGSAQIAADLLQKGIYAQETQGNLDEAIRIYREVVATEAASPFGEPQRQNKAQAQYRLVTCLLQKGDRPGAEKELAALERNFPDQTDLVKNARAMLHVRSELLPEPWTVPESSQLNIRRNGSFTGEYLFYSVDPDTYAPRPTGGPAENIIVLSWELKTAKTTRSVTVPVNRETWLSPVDLWGRPRAPSLESDDDLGDPAAAPFGGPAVDVEVSVFLMRRLPLAVGYKTRLKTHPFTLNHNVPPEVELAVTAIDTIETLGGRYKCYRVSFPALGQTFWIGIEGARPFVKFQSGSVEAELVKTWGPTNVLQSALTFVTAAGIKLDSQEMGPGASGSARFIVEGTAVNVNIRKIYTPKAEIAEALRRWLARSNYSDLRSESVQARMIGGQQALSFIAGNSYFVWVRTESMFLRFSTQISAVNRWRLDQLLSTAKIP